MNRLRAFPLVYLATPYSLHARGIHNAWIDACNLAARLLVEGVKVYSPIAHGHPLAMFGNIDALDHQVWLPFDEAMMTASSALVVATMPGWQESYGVEHEIKFFMTELKPVFFVDPETLKVALSSDSGLEHDASAQSPPSRTPYQNSGAA